MFPENIVQATFQNMQTKYVTVRPKIIKRNDTQALAALARGSYDRLVPSVEYVDGLNVLGIFGLIL